MTSSFHPPHRTLMGPGPSDVSPRVLEALGRPTIGHLDPLFVSLMEEIKGLLQYVFQTKNTFTLPISAPGSAGMEACLVNLIEPGEKVVVCRNGVFGGRMADIVSRCGAEAVVVDDPWGRAVDPGKLEETLRVHPDANLVAFVHAETSTGAQSDAATLARIARENGCLVVADTVTSLAGTPLKVDEWGLDAVYSGTQKCLSCVPGLSPVTFSDRALEKIRNRKTKVQSWFLDLNLIMGYWGTNQKRSYHHTAPVNALYALHEALVMVKEEGLENAWARHQRNHLALKAGLEALGLSFVVPEDERLPQLNSVSLPEGVDDAMVRGRLLNDFNLEIGAGLGDLAGKVWRIGLMGYASNRENVLLCVSALETILAELGVSVDRGVGTHAAMRALAA
ncbi:MAG: alanine--glyoxylate aminotransferase family protein [Pseudomonadota bacterium]